jgi:thiol:disulfide interchange protein DsbC
LRIGADIVYSDERGDYLLFASRDQSDGHLIETKSKTDLTEARVNKLMALDVPKLPFGDAIKFKQGTGARKLVVFEDPNCHFCKDVEKSLVALKDVTIYTFLIPILGPDSVAKSRNIWCSKDSAQAWRTWMLSGVQPPREMGNCDASTLQRNLALAERYRVNGTPAIIFEDGSRFSGAADLERLQKRLDEVSAAARKG